MSESMATESSARDEKKSFIRCVENSNATLEALFEVLSQSPSQPRSQRQPSELPPSFNEEPKRLDELRKTLGPSVQLPGQLSKNVRHNRINSLPVELPSLYQRHLGSVEYQAPLPAGWEIAKTPEGHSYYINHNERRTQWEDPRITMMGLTSRPNELGSLPVPPLSQPPFGQQLAATGHHPQQHGFPPYYQHTRHMGHNQSLDTTGNMSPIGSDGDHLGIHVHPGYGHMYTHSYSGPMHMHMRSHPAQMPGHAPHHMGGAHGPISSKRSYDFDQKLPVSLQGDPYLSTSSHVRDASRDSGLGYPVTPYQDQSVMEMDDGFDGSQIGPAGQHLPQPGHALQQQQTPMMQNPDDIDLQDFGNSSMLGELNQESHLFGSGAAWV